MVSPHVATSGRRPKLFLTSTIFYRATSQPAPRDSPSHCHKPHLAMAPSRTSTVKSKHAANKSGIRNSKTSTKPQSDGVSKNKKPKSKGPPPKPQKSAGNLATLKKKRRVYTEKELGIPALNMITPIGVEKPKGKKKGKVFMDDRVCIHWKQNESTMFNAEFFFLHRRA